ETLNILDESYKIPGIGFERLIIRLIQQYAFEQNKNFTTETYQPDLGIRVDAIIFGGIDNYEKDVFVEIKYIRSKSISILKLAFARYFLRVKKMPSDIIFLFILPIDLKKSEKENIINFLR